MSFIDSAGVEALAEVNEKAFILIELISRPPQVSNELHSKKIQVALAACPPPVLSMLYRTDFFERSKFAQIYPSVQEASQHKEEHDGKKMMQIVP